jgi:hypothetical protein
MKTLSLPPKFAVFKKIVSFDCKSEVEKAFTKLRWKRTFENSTRSDDVDTSSADSEIDCNTFFSAESNDFD